MDNEPRVKIYFNDNSTFTGTTKESLQFTQNQIKDLKIDRVDGPAVEYSWGTKIWYRDGFYHREDGPAVEYPDGSLDYWIEGYLHRLDGPARILKHSNGVVAKEWYIRGIQINPILVTKILKYKRKSSLLPLLLDKDLPIRVLAEFRLKELENKES